MKIAIIGTGISGLTCGYYLNKNHDVTLYEANDYIGGHTATVDVEVKGQRYAVDTGFIVYNDKTYPNFISLMDEIGIKGVATQMSFSVRNDSHGLEYNGHTLATLFAQRANLLNPRFYRFIWEILRFNKMAKQSRDSDDKKTLGEFLNEHSFSSYFCDNYILPMGAAIWSSTIADMREFPLPFFLRFFLNHGLLDITNRPQWRVITGGSRSYIEPLIESFRHCIRLNSPVEGIRRCGDKVLVSCDGQKEQYDEVIFACHSDQALSMLSDCSEVESDILSQLPYQANEVVLHTDTRLLPKRSKAWASWNYFLQGEMGEEQQKPRLTYNMNILQHIQSDSTFCVSLNSSDMIDESQVLKRFIYHHPVFNNDSIAAQKRKNEINGINRSWFCGAYWYNGFHEDGVRSALDVIRGIESSHRDNLVKGAA